MSDSRNKFDLEAIKELLQSFDERLNRIEKQLEISPAKRGQEENELLNVIKTTEPSDEDELEFKVGQNWFAKVGIVALAIGIAFLLTFPYEGLPTAAPGIFGFFLSAGVFSLSYLWRNSFDLVSRYLRGAAMLLLFFTTLRLFFFSPIPALDITSFAGRTLVIAVTITNLIIAFKRKSSYLAGLAATMGYIASVIIGSYSISLVMIFFLSILSVYWYWQNYWNGYYLYAIALNYSTFLVLLLNTQLFTNNTVVTFPLPGIHLVLIQYILYAAGILFRDRNIPERAEDIIGSAINGVFSFGLYTGFSFLELKSSLTINELFASAVLIGLAILFWVYKKSQYSTFIYSMLGYSALSIAILNAFDVPNLFVWLSVQSLIVVATAVWFRSRFIVVANFVIYIAVVIGYVIGSQSESGISIGFGIVALISARILNWQKQRLTLKTDAMRIAYLASAFLVFPYALYYLVPREYVALSWIGVAMFYYIMNLIIRNQKYRWMGHITLLLTVLYVLVIGIIQLEPAYRILSFLVIGVVLLTISLIFTRLRNRQQKNNMGEKTPTEISA